MAVSGGAVNITLGMDSTSFNKGLTTADRAFAQSNKRIQDGLKKQSIGFNAMRKSANMATTAIAGLSVAFVTFSRRSFKVAASVAEMNQAITAIGKSSGQGAGAIHGAAKEIRGMGIEMKAAQEIALLFVQGNLDLAKASKVARVAQDLAVVSQSNSTQTAKTLAYAIQTGNSRLLKSAGITKYAGEAYMDYAKELGKTTTELTASERQQAVLNMILEEGAKVAGTYEAAMLESGKVLRSFPRIINDIQLAFGELFLSGFGPVIKSAYDALKAFSKLLREGGYLHPILLQLEDAFAKMTAPIKGVMDNLTAFFKELNEGQAAVGDISKKVQQLVGPLSGLAVALTAVTGKKLLGALPVVGNLLDKMIPSGFLAGLATFAITTPQVRNAVLDLAEGLKPLALSLANLAQALQGPMLSAVDAFTVILGAATKIIIPLSQALAGFINLLAENEEVLMVVVSALVAYKVANSKLATAVIPSAVNAMKKMNETLIVQQHLGAMNGQVISRFALAWQIGMRQMSVAFLAFMKSIAPLLILTGVIYGISKALSFFKNRGKEAKERMESLKQEMIDTGDATADLSERTVKLAEDYNKLTEATEASVKQFEGMAGTATLMKELMNRDVGPALGAVSEEFMQVMVQAVKGGTDEFQALEKELNVMNMTTEQFINKLNTADPSIQHVTRRLATFVDQGLMTTDQVKEMIDALDETADAFDDYGKEMEKVNEQAVFDNLQTFIDAIGSEAVGAILQDVADGTTNYTGALEALNGAVQTATDEFEYFQQQALEGQKRALAEAKEITEEYSKAIEGTYFAYNLADDASHKYYQGILKAIDALELAEGQATYSTEQLKEALFDQKFEAIDNAKAIHDLVKQSQSWLDTVYELESEYEDITDLGYRLYDNFVNLATGMKNAGATAHEISAAQTDLIMNFYDVAEAAGFTTSEIDLMIDSLGLLDGMTAQGEFVLSMRGQMTNLDEMVRMMEIAYFLTGQGGENLAFLKEMQSLRDKGTSFTSTGRKKRPKTGGGGKAKETPYDLAGGLGGLGQMFGAGSADRLVGATPEGIAGFFDNIIANGIDVMANTKGKSKAKLEKLLVALGMGSSNLQSLAISASNFATKLISAEDELAVAEDNLADALARKNALLEESIDLQNRSVESARNQVFASDLLKTQKSGVVFSAEAVLAKYTTFRNNLKEMKNRGFPPSLIAEVYKAGPDAGIAGNILSMDAGGLENYIMTMKQIDAIAKEAGGYGADAMFGADLSKAEADITEAKANRLSAKENVAALSSSLDSLTTAMYDMISTLQTGFLEGLQGMGGSGIGAISTELATGVTAPNQVIGTTGQPTNITVNMPAGSDGDDVVRALQEYMRKNGSVPILTVEP